MPHVRVKENEPFDVALRRFKRSCEKAGVLAEVRRREYYEKPAWARKRKAAAAGLYASPDSDAGPRRATARVDRAAPLPRLAL